MRRPNSSIVLLMYLLCRSLYLYSTLVVMTLISVNLGCKLLFVKLNVMKKNRLAVSFLYIIKTIKKKGEELEFDHSYN